jgi:pyridoxal phosphate enzyme (YggS family)
MIPAVPADRQAEIRERLAAIEARIAAACAAAGRARADVTLVAVTKTWPASDVAALLAAAPDAPRDLGEARDQEAARKARELAAAGVSGLRWHFVGRLQTNKARSVASYADVVHSVDRLPLVAALGDGSRRAGRELAVLLQLSLDGDPSRGGALPEDVPALADAAAAEEGLRPVGVMAVAPRGADPAESFARLAAAAERLRRDYPDATWVSAGMSGDLEQAVAAGATHLRVGSALFGGRPPPGR